MSKVSDKTTGEIPLLFVFEVDPMIVEEGSESEASQDINATAAESTDLTPSTENVIPTPVKNTEIRYSFLAVCQRKVELMNTPMFHPWYQRVFGTPFILRVADLEGYTGRDLYDLVAKRVENYVPEAVLKFLHQGRDELDDPTNGVDYYENSGKLRTGRRQRFNRTKSDAEDSAFGKVPRYGFRLRVTSRDGRTCELCPWYDCCTGCLITDDDYPTIAMCGDTIAIDWHVAIEVATDSFDALSSGVEPRANMLTNVKKHKTSRGSRNKSGSGFITLDDCLDAFTKEEKMPDVSCDIFCCVLTAFLASLSQHLLLLNLQTYCSKCKELRVQTKQMSLWRLPPVLIITLKRFKFTESIKRKLRDYVHFPVEGFDFSRIVASDKNEAAGSAKASSSSDAQDNAALRPDVHCGRTESLYDLFAVIHHQGDFTGGHYVASLKSESDGKWRLFNDASIYEVSSKDVVDASAYILFYVRRDVKRASLEDFWDTQPREGEGMTEEEVEKMMKQKDRCTIS